MAGPAYFAAACPVRTKIPAPMIAADAQRREIDRAEHAFEALVSQRLGLQIGHAPTGE